MTAERCVELSDAHYNVQVGIRYHMYRQGFYIRLGTMMAIAYLALLIVALLCCTAGGEVAGLRPEIASALLLVVLSAGTVGYASDRARLHDDLRCKYLELEAQIFRGEGAEKGWLECICRIEAQEPPIKRALVSFCQDEVNYINGLQRSKAMPWYKALTKQLISWA